VNNSDKIIIDIDGVNILKFLKLLIYTLLVYTIIIFSSISLYGMVEKSDSVFFKIFFFVLFYIIISFINFLIYKISSKENEDIALLKRQYYFIKPFIIKVNQDGKILEINKTVEEKISNFSLYTYLSDFSSFPSKQDHLNNVLRQHPFTCAFKDNNNETIYIHFIPLKKKRFYYLIGEDVTNDLVKYQNYERLALYDKITGLPNLNYFNLKIDELLNDFELKDKKNSLVVFDIQGFKNINRLFGMKIGDETLRTFSKIVEEYLTNFNYQLFNLELDQFAIILYDLERYQLVNEWLDNFSKIFDKPIDVQGNLFTVKIKAGIFNLDFKKYPNLTKEEVLENAKVALKKAKESRMLDYALFDQAISKYFTRTQLMESDLANAIKNNEFILFFQPQLNCKANKIGGFEALVRWDNPKYELDSPAMFLDLAEKNNYIIDIGRYVINESFKIAKELEKFDVRISINISPLQLLHTGFVYEIINIFNQYKLKKGAIVFEITETFLMESLDEVIEKLTILRKSGILIHLDNFGTGYSSMLYLKDLPVDGISINKEFIRGITSDQFSRTLICEIIKLANNLGIEVVAEGVEESKQFTFLLENGCTIIQGYFFSKPLPKDEAFSFMLNYNHKK